ncbi:MAG TPA: hypothetical protein VJ922_09570 [Actinomycetota bacterium]|nr:hypothetical protein [Actinomycetota bacterium]
MRRRTFDTLMSTGGVVLTIVLLVAGALLMVGYNFANDNVKQQLSAQKIFFPQADSEGLKDPRIGPFIKQYAGQQLTTGAQAEAYANHYIGVHIADSADGKTYAEMGAVQTGLRGDIATAKAANDTAKVTALEAQLAEASSTRDTIFKGETLRGLLLNAYAFWKVGQIAFLAAIAAFAMAGVMGILSILGFWHLRRVPVEEELLAPHVKATPVTA